MKSRFREGQVGEACQFLLSPVRCDASTEIDAHTIPSASAPPVAASTDLQKKKSTRKSRVLVEFEGFVVVLIFPLYSGLSCEGEILSSFFPLCTLNRNMKKKGSKKVGSSFFGCFQLAAVSSQQSFLSIFFFSFERRVRVNYFFPPLFSQLEPHIQRRD